jgi:homogentisate 1,2-dioxygenase
MMEISFKYGDYLIIPRGIIYQIDFDSQETDYFMSNLCSILHAKAVKTGLDNYLDILLLRTRFYFA